MSDNKTCTKCKKDKPPTEYYKDERHKDGLHSACKECHKKAIKKSRQNKESISDAVDDLYDYSYYRELCKSLNITTSVTKDNIKDVLDFWNRQCAYCGNSYDKITHIIPVDEQWRGANIIHNLMTICNDCYDHKGQLDIFFYATITGKSLTNILLWAARNPELIEHLNGIRERVCPHSFENDIKFAKETILNLA